MRELSLFTGAGGGILGTHLLGWEPIGYVEWDSYCQKVLAARIADGFIPSAPIFGDIRQFVQSGSAREYRGFADVVTAGFPCQPFSNAGNQRGADDPRNMWPATRDVIRDVRPRHVMLENVPGLLSVGYASVVVGELAAMGYVGQSGCISAANTGAMHKRERWWVVAHDDCHRCDPHGEREERFEQPTFGSTLAPGGKRAHTSRPEIMADAERNGRQRICDWRDAPIANGYDARRTTARADSTRDAADTNSESLGRPTEPRRQCREWPTEPDVGRVAHGVAARVDRLKALGNGQVPRVVTTAWELLK